MKNANLVRRAAMGALVAGALMVGAQQASAKPYRYPADGFEWMLPWGRAKLADDVSAIVASVKAMLSAVRVFPA